ncbi:hypothetical protein IDM40_10825 [Nocardiopsis sp. HNM0947]|uniref:Uncharacterized protein n=1 Tax=Nocardiopsis coralli TaxID=2772213 RepID=A0ABR9P5T2_9ACTN|nr:hypothetical protein [Nocardiopsis coralli]MBE2999193.1 hypothetical protein [Nocardiopsis coralli]
MPSDAISSLALTVVFIALALYAAHHVVKGGVLAALRQHAHEQRDLEERRARRDAGPGSGA